MKASSSLTLGMTLPDINLMCDLKIYTRMILNVGGDDVTEFLYVLLERTGFPYRDINLARSYDWHIMEDLKTRICTLAEVRRNYFVVRADPLTSKMARGMWRSIYTSLWFENQASQLKNTGFALTTKSFWHQW